MSHSFIHIRCEASRAAAQQQQQQLQSPSSSAAAAAAAASASFLFGKSLRKWPSSGPATYLKQSASFHWCPRCTRAHGLLPGCSRPNRPNRPFLWPMDKTHFNFGYTKLAAICAWRLSLCIPFNPFALKVSMSVSLYICIYMCVCVCVPAVRVRAVFVLTHHHHGHNCFMARVITYALPYPSLQLPRTVCTHFSMNIFTQLCFYLKVENCTEISCAMCPIESALCVCNFSQSFHCIFQANAPKLPDFPTNCSQPTNIQMRFQAPDNKLAN